MGATFAVLISFIRFGTHAWKGAMVMGTALEPKQM
jgi:hypothetical protein